MWYKQDRRFSLILFLFVFEEKMQKRRVRSNDMQLPVTMDDAANPPSAFKSGGRRNRRGGNKQSSPSTALACALFLFVIGAIGLLVRKNDFAPKPTSRKMGSDNYPQTLALEKIKSLDDAFAHSKIVGLYFAASWCGMSTPVSQNIDALFYKDEEGSTSKIASKVLTQSDIEQKIEKDLAIVYVSSDYTKGELDSYIADRPYWLSVPFDSPDKTAIKQHFRICAHVEQESLGIPERRAEIPSLVILDSKTHGVLSTSGVSDLRDYEDEVLDHWLSLHSLVRTLEDKYEEE